MVPQKVPVMVQPPALLEVVPMKTELAAFQSGLPMLPSPVRPFPVTPMMPRLRTRPLPNDRLSSRRRRAKRQSPNCCYQHYSDASHDRLPRLTPHEIDT
jgi:hypothetical protein